ncbi:hypothetical protein INR49_027157 [Caranx melampygus]|nr:hypothetical protein INR49_027157 [Caranx melampygus]
MGHPISLRQPITAFPTTRVGGNETQKEGPIGELPPSSTEPPGEGEDRSTVANQYARRKTTIMILTMKRNNGWGCSNRAGCRIAVTAGEGRTTVQKHAGAATYSVFKEETGIGSFFRLASDFGGPLHLSLQQQVWLTLYLTPL